MGKKPPRTTLTAPGPDHAGWGFHGCGDCAACCDGSLFHLALTPPSELIRAAEFFPVVFVKRGRFLPVILFAFQAGSPCLHLLSLTGGCAIYDRFRAASCHGFPFAQGEGGEVVMDLRCGGLGAPPGDLPLPQAAAAFLPEERMAQRIENEGSVDALSRTLDYMGLVREIRVPRMSRKGKPQWGRKKALSIWIVDRERFDQFSRDDFKAYGGEDLRPLMEAHLASLSRLTALAPQEVWRLATREGGVHL